MAYEAVSANARIHVGALLRRDRLLEDRLGYLFRIVRIQNASSCFGTGVRDRFRAAFLRHLPSVHTAEAATWQCEYVT